MEFCDVLKSEACRRKLAIVSFMVIALFTLSCEKETPPTSIRLIPENLMSYVGGSDTIVAVLSPLDALTTITWSSGNSQVATIDSYGIISGVSAGTAVITATTENNLTATCKVTVAKWTEYPDYGYAFSITTEKSGVTWFGTSVGVWKFDGLNSTNYKTTNSGLAGNEVRAVVVDADGNKWFGTNNGGISKFDGTTWTTYNTNNSGLAHNTILCAAIDAHGNKWFGTVLGVSKFDGTNWTTYTSANSGLTGSNANDAVFGVAIDDQDNKWFTTLQKGVSKFDGDTWTNYNVANSGLVNDIVNCITIDSQGNKWFGTKNGVSKFDGTNWTTYTTSNSGLADNAVSAIAIDGKGGKWVATGTGASVSHFDDVNWTIYNAANSPLIRYSYVYAIAVDAHENKWIGTVPMLKLDAQK